MGLGLGWVQESRTVIILPSKYIQPLTKDMQ